MRDTLSAPRLLTPDDLRMPLPVPGVTDHAMFCGEDGDWFGYGHIDPAEFVRIVMACEVAYGNMTEEDVHQQPLEPSWVQHRWAVLVEGDHDPRILWVREGTVATAITFLAS